MDPASSIVGFTITIIGLLATIRNGVGTIVTDKSRLENWYKELLPFYFELEIVSESMEVWRRFWMIRDGVHSSLLTRYWGYDAAQAIALCVASIHSTLQELRVEFNSAYKPKRFGPLYALGEKEGSANLDPESFEMIKVDQLRAKFKKYRKRFGFHHQVYLALFKSTIFQQRLASLRASVNRLNEMSRLAYTRKWGSVLDKLEDSVAETRMEYFLTQNEKEVTHILDIISDEFQDHTVQVDWQIDQSYGESTAQRSDAIYERIIDGRSKHCLLIALQRHSITAEITLKIGPDKFTDEEIKSESAVVSTLEEALNTAEDESNSSTQQQSHPQREIFVRRGEFFVPFALARYRERLKSDSISIKNLFAFEAPTSIHAIVQTKFLLRERLKLAYEMAESFLIFLKSHWFADICTCQVRRTCWSDMEGEYDYWLTISRVSDHITNSPLCTPTERHIGSQSSKARSKAPKRIVDERSRLRHDISNRHIRRFGHFLIEVATESVTGYHPWDQQMASQTRETMKLVAGDDYIEVVEYCLAQNASPDQITRHDLENFYRRVVSRLYYHYRARVERFDRFRRDASIKSHNA